MLIYVICTFVCLLVYLKCHTSKLHDFLPVAYDDIAIKLCISGLVGDVMFYIRGHVRIKITGHKCSTYSPWAGTRLWRNVVN